MMSLSEIVNRVIDLSGKVYDYYMAELPKRHPNYPLVNPGDEDTPPPPEEKELKDFLESLPVDTIHQLILIGKLGRSEIRADDLAETYEALKSEFRDPEYAIFELTSRVPMSYGLMDGLEELRRHKINVDKMPLKKVKLRKR